MLIILRKDYIKNDINVALIPHYIILVLKNWQSKTTAWIYFSYCVKYFVTTLNIVCTRDLWF